MNNPLKYTDPSGLTDVVVTAQAIPDEVAAYAALLGIRLDTAYTITSATGEQITGLGFSANGAATIYELSNTMRKMEGDIELNIVIPGEDIRDSILNRYTYNKGDDIPRSWGEYYYIGESTFSPGSAIWRLYESSMGPEPYDWIVGLDLLIVGGVSASISLPSIVTAIVEAGGGSVYMTNAILKTMAGGISVSMILNTLSNNISSIGNITINWDPDNPPQLIVQYK